jgi:hypothetical protein
MITSFIMELPSESIFMKRDMDLVRTILLKVEGDPKFDGSLHPANGAELGIEGHCERAIAYNCAQLVEAGFLTGNTKHATQGMVIVGKLTWEGHEFLDAVRDPDIWRKTKERAKGLASVGLGFLWEIAKGEVKTKLGLP